MAQLADGELAEWETRTGPCHLKTGAIASDGRWAMTVYATVSLPEGKHEAALRALRDTWKADGWQIYADEEQTDRRLLGGEDPEAATHFTLTARKAAPRISMVVNVFEFRRSAAALSSIR
ncbi:hypothetical protein AB0M36_07180 [Actinoplanes sp. NPDC051346]|uniref:hypothetical protein n=1 Tax=Actinoplanes sp. NPDC051346 TaxID=3155048 RepID=UPI003431E42A